MAGVGYLGAGTPEARVKRAHTWQGIEERLHVSVDEVRGTVRNLFKAPMANTEGLRRKPWGGEIRPLRVAYIGHPVPFPDS